MNLIDTIMEDDKENAQSTTIHADSEKDSKTASASVSARSATTYRKQGQHGQHKSTGCAFSELTTFSAGNNAQPSE